MICAYQSLRYNWFPKGHQRKIPTYGRHQGAKLFGVLNYETVSVMMRPHSFSFLIPFYKRIRPARLL